RKRKRRLQTHDSRRTAAAGVAAADGGFSAGASGSVSAYVVTPGADVSESLRLFDIMKNEEKVRMAGQRVKLVAAVGGVVRSAAHAMALTDARYHLYRLWTCVAGFSDIAPLLAPRTAAAAAATSGGFFSELIVVHDFMNAFDEPNVEPHVRVAQLRVPCGAQRLDELVVRYAASTDGEQRAEIPVWLAVVAKADGSHALALLVCSPVIEPAAALLSYRQFSDTELASAMAPAHAEAGGAGARIGDVAVTSIGGLEPWPLAPSAAAAVVMSHGQVAQASAASAVAGGDESHLMVSSLFTGFKGVLDAWCEPRILSSMAYARLLEYAATGTPGVSPDYSLLSGDALTLSAAIPEPVGPARLLPLLNGNSKNNSNESSVSSSRALAVQSPASASWQYQHQNQLQHQPYPLSHASVPAGSYLNFAANTP
ncbi:hypothetical protein H4S06_006354, partial [Coemansia sp. BCRC 34490]